MNDILPTPINTKQITKTFSLLLILCCLLPIILNITLLTPIYFSLENNTVYRGTAITLTLKYISDLFDLISFSSVYAMMIFALVLLKKKVQVLLAISYIALLIFKIPARILMNIPLYGTIGTTEGIIADLISLTFYFLLEALQFTLILIFSANCAKNYLHSIAIITEKNKKSKKDKHNKNIENIEYVLPIKKFINWYNPLLRAAIYSSCTIIGFKFFARLITDIDAGLPTSFGEVMIIIINYLTDAVYGIVAYIIAIFMFNLLFEKLATKDNTNKNKEEGKKNDNESDKKEADENNSSALFED